MNAPNLPAVIQAVESRLPELKKLLPADVSPDAFLSHFKTAAMTVRNLLDATPRSVVLACVKAANDGLVLDGREAVVVVRNQKQPVRQADGRTKDQWVKVAVYQRMYTGTLKRIRQALPGCTVESRLVYEGDHFQIEFGDKPSIVHMPRFGEKRGEMVGCYAIVTEKDGTRHRDFMEREEVERIRDHSQNYDPTDPKGVWHDHFGEMAKKTVLNRLAKLLPQGVGRPALAADADDTGGADDDIGEIFDGTVALPEEEKPAIEAAPPAPEPQPVKANGNGVKIGNHGTITSGKQSVDEDVALWKTRLRELRGTIAESLGKVVVEQEWEEWDRKYAPVPEEVTAAAKQIIDKRLAALDAAIAAYAEQTRGGA